MSKKKRKAGYYRVQRISGLWIIVMYSELSNMWHYNDGNSCMMLDDYQFAKIDENVIRPYPTEKRPFEDLLNKIEFEGEKFIPIVKIVALAFNYNEKAVLKRSDKWINKGYDCALHYMFETDICKPKKHLCNLVMFRDFNMSVSHKIGKKKETSNTGMPPCNQIKIVKLLIKWGFVE